MPVGAAKLAPGRRAAAVGAPDEARGLHADIRLLGTDHDTLELLAERVCRRRARRQLPFELRLEVPDPLPDRVRRLLGALNVAGLLHRPPRSPRGGRGAADRRRRNRLSPEESAEYRRADGDRRLDAGLHGFLLLAADRLLRAPQTLLQGRELPGVFLAELVGVGVPPLAGVLLEARPKIRLALTRLRDGAGGRALPEFERVLSIDPCREVLPPGLGRLRAHGGSEIRESGIAVRLRIELIGREIGRLSPAPVERGCERYDARDLLG